MNYSGDLGRIDAMGSPRIRSRKSPSFVLLANVIKGSRFVVEQGTVLEEEMVPSLDLKVISPSRLYHRSRVPTQTSVGKSSGRIALRT